MNLVLVVLICAATSFGVVTDNKPQCAVGAPGAIEARVLPGKYQDPASCAEAGLREVVPYLSDQMIKGRVATWACLSEKEAANVK